MIIHCPLFHIINFINLWITEDVTMQRYEHKDPSIYTCIQPNPTKSIFARIEVNLTDLTFSQDANKSFCLCGFTFRYFVTYRAIGKRPQHRSLNAKLINLFFQTNIFLSSEFDRIWINTYKMTSPFDLDDSSFMLLKSH